MTALLTLTGMLCVCFSMTRHQREVFARPLVRARSRSLQGLGWTALILSFGVSVAGGATSILQWLGELSLAALTAAGICAIFATWRQRSGRK